MTSFGASLPLDLLVLWDGNGRRPFIDLYVQNLGGIKPTFR